MIQTGRWISIVALALAAACGSNGSNGSKAPEDRVTALIGAPADPGPTVAFKQVGTAVGLVRANEPASAVACQQRLSNVLSYGTWLADFDGDGKLDVYDVNHGQDCHLSGLWLNSGAGGFGQNLWSVAFHSAAKHGATLGLSNEVYFVGDLTGDGRVDLYFLDWSGLGAMCVNTGTASHSDWTGPSFDCYQSLQPRTFADVNGDGRIDVEVLDPSTPYDFYKAYCRTLPTMWRLNNGNPDINNWPTSANPFDFVGHAAPGALLDFNKDGYPDKIQGTELADGARGDYGTSSGGLHVSLGRPDGTYVPVTSGLEGVTSPVVRLEDIDEDGCVDVGTDRTGYRDNQDWYIQDRSGSTCLVTFHAVARTALPYYPGARRYSVDVDNDGLLDRVVLVHGGYGNNDGRATGAHVFRALPGGGFTDLGASGINILGTDPSEFYADELSPGDWNGDGKIDFAGAGTTSIAGTDVGIALWTSALASTNHWVKVATPTVSGFFQGTAKIEIFDAGGAGDPSRLAAAARVLRTGEAWATQDHHFGIGTRSSVDVVVTFPDGSQGVRSNVAADSAISVSSATVPAPPPPMPSPPPQPAPPPVPPPPLDAIDGFTVSPHLASGVSVASVTWSVDGVARPSQTTAPYPLTVLMSELSTGTHVLACQVTDTKGQASIVKSLSITK